MEQKKGFDKGRYNFMGLAKPMGILSVVATVVSLVIIFGKGLNYGIDFAGGTEVQVQFKEAVSSSRLRDTLATLGFRQASVQEFEGNNEFLLRFDAAKGATEKETNEMNNALIKKISEGLETNFQSEGAVIRRVDSVGPQIGDELKRNSILATFYSLLMILIYVGLRFDFKYAPGAVICLFHDAIVSLGIFALMGKEVNVQILAAILTIIGYSLNDTIVNFDRIRENIKIFRDQPLVDVMNRSINDVLSRTILTALTTFLSAMALFIFAGGVLSDFALIFGIGVIVGVYSSVYVASPMALIFEKFSAAKA